MVRTGSIVFLAMLPALITIGSAMPASAASLAAHASGTSMRLSDTLMREKRDTTGLILNTGVLSVEKLVSMLLDGTIDGKMLIAAIDAKKLLELFTGTGGLDLTKLVAIFDVKKLIAEIEAKKLLSLKPAAASATSATLTLSPLLVNILAGIAGMNKPSTADSTEDKKNENKNKFTTVKPTTDSYGNSGSADQSTEAATAVPVPLDSAAGNPGALGGSDLTSMMMPALSSLLGSMTGGAPADDSSTGLGGASDVMSSLMPAGLGSSLLSGAASLLPAMMGADPSTAGLGNLLGGLSGTEDSQSTNGLSQLFGNVLGNL